MSVKQKVLGTKKQGLSNPCFFVRECCVIVIVLVLVLLLQFQINYVPLGVFVEILDW